MRNQRGQVLVIFAGGLLVLMAIAALVIDIGLVFMIHRHEQNAADPGALAAARYIRYPGPTADTTKMFRAACFYARQNGYFRVATDNSNGSTGCVAANDDAGTTLAIHYPPGPSAGEYAGRPGFVEVALTEVHQSFFAGLIGMSRIPVTSAAVAAFNIGDSNSNSLVALKPTGCSTLQINGGAGVTIQPTVPGTNGGYIMVDSNCGAVGDATPDQCSGGGSGAFEITGNSTVTAPSAYIVGRCKLTNNPTANFSTVDEGAAYYADPLSGLIGPSATGTGAFCEPLGRNLVPGDSGCTYQTLATFNLSPGVYYGGIKVMTNKPILNLTPGIYIMAGGGFTPNNGEIDSAAGDILIYSTDVAQYYGANCLATAPNANYCQGNIFVNGQANINLSALNLDPCPPVSSTGCPYVGMLFWMDQHASIAASGGTPTITINGGTNLRLSGTIYNPAGDTTVNGGSSTTGCSGSNQNCASIQVISNTIKINGGSGLSMPYDPNKLYHLDNQGLVH
jgi:hypothetical protein